MSELCEGCHQPLTGQGRADRRFHGGPCRKRAWKRRQLERREAAMSPPEPAHAEPAHPLDRDALIEEALSEARLLVYVAQAARTQWRAAAWLLERRHPERWGVGAREIEPELPGNDAFREVDELAQRRRLHPAHPLG
jgi:hypothetical protein